LALEREDRQVEHASQLTPKARLVKLADKIANLRDVADAPPAKWSLVSSVTSATISAISLPKVSTGSSIAV
jgi:hypothetical protein